MNTRFNPTANGPIHVGHVYMALLNEFMAHNSGGKFILRIDDNQRMEQQRIGGAKEMQRYAKGQHRDLAWMGMQIDKIVYQSEMEEKVKGALARSHFRMVVDHVMSCETFPIIQLAGPTISPIQLSTWIVAEKVILDRWENVDAMVRGPEMLQEHALYMYFCALLGYRFPKCYYLPRLLTMGDKNGSMSFENVSKTIGNWRVEDLRDAGVTPGQIRKLLRASCLIDPAGYWCLENVKDSPALTVRGIKDVLG